MTKWRQVFVDCRCEEVEVDAHRRFMDDIVGRIEIIDKKDRVICVVTATRNFREWKDRHSVSLSAGWEWIDDLDRKKFDRWAIAEYKDFRRGKSARGVRSVDSKRAAAEEKLMDLINER